MRKILPVLFVALLLTGCSLVKKEARNVVEDQNMIENQNNEDQNKVAPSNNEIQNNVESQGDGEIKNNSEIQSNTTAPAINAINKEAGDINTSESNIKTPEPITKTPEPVEIDIKDWQIYKNEKYGFTMQYPKDWSMKDRVADCSAIKGEPDKFYALDFFSPEGKFILSWDFRDKNDKLDPWCRTGIGSGGPQTEGKIEIAGVEIVKKYLVDQNKVQEVFYAAADVKAEELTGAFIIGPLKIMSNLYALDSYSAGFDFRNFAELKIADKILESFEFTK